MGIHLDFGRIKNKDSNSVVDKAIQELETEFLKHGTPDVLTPLQLQLAVDTLNSRIRNRNLSAKEIILKRDQFSNDNIEVNDSTLSQEQQAMRARNHLPSARAKAGHTSDVGNTDAVAGDLVYVKNERNKHKLRDRYLVTKTDGPKATIQKLNDKFMSRQYVVPSARLYPTQPHNRPNPKVPNPDESDSSDDDFGCYLNNNGSQGSTHTAVEVDLEDDEEEEDPPAPDVVSVDGEEQDGREQDVGRGRERRQPSWMRSGDYILT